MTRNGSDNYEKKQKQKQKQKIRDEPELPENDESDLKEVETEDENEELGDYKRECSVGMTRYSTSTEGFVGKIKSHFSDFIVQEISETNEIIPLNYEDKEPFGLGPEDDVAYCRFILKKKRIDTLMAAGIIADYLKIPLRNVSWAGIKDGRALTSQTFCVKGNQYSKLKNFNHPDIDLYRFRPAKKPISIGNLWGNYFQIRVKQLQQPIEELKDRILEWTEQIRKFGAPNYYGLQRFGFYRPNSHLIGKALFKMDYETAIDELLFKPYEYEDPDIYNIRQKLSETRDYAQYKSKFHPKMQYERILCEHLENNPTDYKNAILALPFPFRNLLLSSYQSYLFNMAISKRIELGMPIHVPVEDDIISILKSENGPPSNVRFSYLENEKDKLDKAIGAGRANIVAPILGSDQKIEDFGAFSKIYDELLKKEGIEPEFFKISDFKAYSLKGTFRAICIKLTDLQIDYKGDPEKLENEYIEIKFKLPKGSYATVVLRELLKIK